MDSFTGSAAIGHESITLNINTLQTLDRDKAAQQPPADDPEKAQEGAKKQEPPGDVLKKLPVLPIRNTVLFPGTLVPLTIGRSDSLKLLEDNLPTSKYIGLVLQKNVEDEKPEPQNLHEIGVVAQVVKLIRPDEGGAIALVQVEQRMVTKEYLESENYLIARVELLQDTPIDRNNAYWEAKLRNLRETAGNLIDTLENIPRDAKTFVMNIEDPAYLTDLLASNLSIEPEKKQKILEETLVGKRIELVQKSVDDQLRIGDLQQKLRADVQTEFSEAQKRSYLREQMRAIQKELGDEGSVEEQAEELRKRLKESGLPEAAWEQAEKELKRLEMTPTSSPEHSVIVNYLETLADLPWARVSDDVIDLQEARKVLDRDHYGLAKVKKRLIEYLAVRKLNPEGHGPILCFVGPPGVGKTSIGQSIATALGREFVRMSLGGIRDESEIRGHRRTYIGSMPGRIIQELRRAGTRNPVFMLDELDKVGSDFRGDPASALLEVLDPAQNHAFSDRYLDVDFDLSKVIFIATCNTLSTVPAPLRDRMEVIEIAGYTETEKMHIARDYLVGRQLRENGLSPEAVTFADEALQTIIENYTREAGVRNLERRIGAVARGVAAEIVSTQAGPDEAEASASPTRTITAADVEETLGPPTFVREEKLRSSQPGVVTGLAYTPAGGDILYIEAIKYAGRGKISLTGQLGDVMQESVRAAHSLVRSRAKVLNISQDEIDHTDVHVHVPAGAIQKDGPSAGVAMFTALVSMYTNRPVSKDVAMTGEISLRGLVLPIGGLKEKTIAALRAGIKTVIIPKLNEKDLPELPQEVLDRLEIVAVETVDEVLLHALTGEVSTDSSEILDNLHEGNEHGGEEPRHTA